MFDYFSDYGVAILVVTLVVPAISCGLLTPLAVLIAGGLFMKPMMQAFEAVSELEELASG